jgi:small-conductance mechanosensitive channel
MHLEPKHGFPASRPKNQTRRTGEGFLFEYTGKMKITGPSRNLRRALAAGFFSVLTLSLCWSAVGAQGQLPTASPGPVRLDRAAVVNHLNVVIGWYRDSTTKVQTPGEPSDVIYQDNAQNFAAQALRLAFQSAREEAEIMAADEKGTPSGDSGQTSTGSGQPNYPRVQARVAAQISDLQSQIEALNKQLETAPAASRRSVLAKHDALQGQMDLYKSMQDAVQKMATFTETSEASSEGLSGTINTLARSVPQVLANPKAGGTTAKPSSTPPANSNSAGLLGQTMVLYGEFADMHAIGKLIDEMAGVRDAAEAVRSPLRDNLVATIRAGNAIVTQNQGQAQPGPAGPARNPATPASSPASPADVQKQYRDLTSKFNSYSDALVPLVQEMSVLDQSRSNFEEWRRSISRESRITLQTLITRVAGIAFALGLVLLLSEIWRRLTFRYIHDARRRRQFLLLRRFVIGLLLGIVIILGFVTEFSSLATFAGFVTAGIAVGLQTVLLSVAAYFFVIGRYGIRVGDRISISGVTGDVIDIGLVRLYLMELAGPSVDLYPTGRIVVFSNSVLFQAATPLFKQLPGTDYSWHEVVLELAPGGNHKTVQEKVSAAVGSVYESYRGEIERQSRYVDGRAEFQMKPPAPESRLQFGDAGLELLVRYPVELRKEAEIDDHVTRKLLEIISGDPELKGAVSASPKLRAVVKG